MHGADQRMTDIVQRCFLDGAVNGRAGSSLAALLAMSGLRDVMIRAETMVTNQASWAESPLLASSAADAEERGEISAAQRADWLAQLRESARRGSSSSR